VTLCNSSSAASHINVRSKLSHLDFANAPLLPSLLSSGLTGRKFEGCDGPEMNVRTRNICNQGGGDTSDSDLLESM
jgi:hypothetical protein